MKIKARWDGEAFVPIREQKLDKGMVYNLDVSKPRSQQQHGLFFACIAKAFDNWPEQHPFNPVDADQLRYYLEAKAGWGDIIYFENAPALIHFFTRNYSKPMFAFSESSGFQVVCAKSIAYGKMGKLDFASFVNAVDDVLKKEVGFSMMDLKESAITDAQ